MKRKNIGQINSLMSVALTASIVTTAIPLNVFADTSNQKTYNISNLVESLQDNIPVINLNDLSYYDIVYTLGDSQEIMVNNERKTLQLGKNTINVDGKEYHIRCKKISYKIENKHEIKPGQKVKIVFEGLDKAFGSEAGKFNPNNIMSRYYTDINGLDIVQSEDATRGGNDVNIIEFVVPENTAPGEYTLSNGCIYQKWWGNSVPGASQTDDKFGNEFEKEFSWIPDVKFTVKENKEEIHEIDLSKWSSEYDVVYTLEENAKVKINNDIKTLNLGDNEIIENEKKYNIKCKQISYEVKQPEYIAPGGKVEISINGLEKPLNESVELRYNTDVNGIETIKFDNLNNITFEIPENTDPGEYTLSNGYIYQRWVGPQGIPGENVIIPPFMCERDFSKLPNLNIVVNEESAKDTEAPIISTSLQDKIVEEEKFIFEVSATDNRTENVHISVKLNNESIEKLENNTYEVTLIEGENVISIEASDDVGNKINNTYTVTYNKSIGKDLVIKEINGLPEFDKIDLRHEEKLNYINELYTALSDEDKTQINNIEKLQKAINRVQEMKKSPQLQELESEWSSHRGNVNNSALVDFKLPTNKENISEKWSAKGASGIIVEDYIFTSKGSNLRKINKETGEEVLTADIPGGEGFYSYLVYGDGKIFVPANGCIIAYNASTLDLLWKSEKLTNGGTQSLSTVTYHDGYLYTGLTNGASVNSKGGFVAMSTRDDNPLSNSEEKDFTWTETSQGYYGAGGTIIGDNIVFGGDDGDIFICDRKTGEVKDKKNVGAQVRSAIVNEKGTLYFTAADILCKLEVEENGKFGELLISKLDSASTVSPVIYKDNLYVVSGRMTSAGGYAYVYNTENLERVDTLKLSGISQSSPIVTSAYEEEGEIYMYLTTNEADGKLVAVKHNLNTNKLEKSFEYSPSTKQYSMLSPICSNDGTIYFGNDSGKLFAVSEKSNQGEVNSKPEIKAEDRTINLGDKFDPMSGVEVIDKEDGTITPTYKIDDTNKIINSNVAIKEGTFNVTYIAKDSAGASVTKTIKVTVKAKDGVKIGSTENEINELKQEITQALQNNQDKVKPAEVETLEDGKYLYTVKIPKAKTKTEGDYIIVKLILSKDEIKPIIKGVKSISAKVGDKVELLSGITSEDKLGVPVNVTVKNEKQLPLQNGKVTKSGKYTVEYSAKIGDIETISSATMEVKSSVINGGGSIEKPSLIQNKLVGETRYSTAVKVSKRGWSKSENIVIVNSNAMSDALSATPFAKSKNAPILLTEAGTLNSETKNEITRLQAKHVYVIGGENVVSEKVLTQLKDMGLNIERISGEDRYQTSLKIAEKLGDVSNIALVNGVTGLPDAVSIAPVAANENMPILLSSPTQGTKVVDEFIKANNIKTTYVIGGESAISNDVANKLPNATRLGGKDRNETNVAILEKFYTGKALNNIFVAKNGMNKQDDLIDALGVGVLAAKEQSPIVIVGDTLSANQEKLLSLKTTKEITQVGGNGNENAFNKLVSMLKNK